MNTDIDPIKAARKVAEHVQGTGMSLPAAFEALDMPESLQDDSRFCAELDQLVFCCTCCDNWYEQSEMSENEDWVCEDCCAEEW